MLFRVTMMCLNSPTCIYNLNFLRKLYSGLSLKQRWGERGGKGLVWISRSREEGRNGREERKGRREKGKR